MTQQQEPEKTAEPPVQQAPNALARTARELRVVEDDGPLAYLMDTARFEHVQRIARVMAMGSVCPEHLRGKNVEEGIANCFRVANQAIRWGLDPFAVADASYLVYGRLGYEGKLITAVVNTRAGLGAPLSAIYNAKKGDDFACVVYGAVNPIQESALPLLESYAAGEDFGALNKLTFMGVKASRLTVGEGKTFEKDGKTVKGPWLKNLSQKLFYSCVAKWARRWMPEILLGVFTDDELSGLANARVLSVESLPTSGRVSLRNGDSHAPSEPTDTESRAAESARELTVTIAERLNMADSAREIEEIDAEAVRNKRVLGEDGWAAYCRQRDERRRQLQAAGREPGEDGE